VEQLVNNLGGLLQPIIVRLEERFDQYLYEKTLGFVNCYKTNEAYRQGIILTINGMLHSVSKDNCRNIVEQTQTIEIIQSTLREEIFDAALKRMATGLF
jgi:hypothetical protein